MNKQHWRFIFVCANLEEVFNVFSQVWSEIHQEDQAEFILGMQIACQATVAKTVN